MNTTNIRYLKMLKTAFGTVITNLLEDKNIIEIMLNPDGKLWAESLTQGKFFTDTIIDVQIAQNIINLVASNHQTIVNAEHPEIACDLPESYARFQGWLPPIVIAPCFTIRKRAISIFSLEHYLTAKSITHHYAQLLKQAVKNKKNILIAGGTASGKTTFANALLHELKDSNERIIILEDLPELQIAVADYVKLMTTEKKSMRDLVKGTLRMRPDRIIIGEVRDGAALELLKSWNTGHPGGICTIHANSPEATLLRLEDLIQEAVAIIPHRLIQETVNLIVFMQRDPEGKYQVATVHAYEKKPNGDATLRLL